MTLFGVLWWPPVRNAADTVFQHFINKCLGKADSTKVKSIEMGKQQNGASVYFYDQEDFDLPIKGKASTKERFLLQKWTAPVPKKGDLIEIQETMYEVVYTYGSVGPKDNELRTVVVCKRSIEKAVKLPG